MKISVSVVYAFSGNGARGNAAGVYYSEQELDDALQQKIAALMGLSETAFLTPLQNAYRLRWFTPTQEVNLCGHATLAAAAFLSNQSGQGSGDFVFETRSGRLKVSVKGAAAELFFPLDVIQAADTPDALAKALGCEVIDFYKGPLYDLAVCETENSIRKLQPDFDLLAEIAPGGLIVSAASDMPQNYDFVSRFFAPGCGIDEDPATGSAQCTLYPYWAKRLAREKLISYQVSEQGGLFEVKKADANTVSITGEFKVDAQPRLIQIF